ncbi:J domain-containing protein [Thermodesulfobacteriota bacterium]
MDEPSGIVQWIIILGGFVVGYYMVSFIWKNVKTQNLNKYINNILYKIANENSFKKEKVAREKLISMADKALPTINVQDEDLKYAQVLGLGVNSSVADIQKAFLKLSDQYDPEKFNHLNEDFKQMAKAKLIEIQEAYNYFRTKYNI